jgi:uncharacterized lipoprotein
MKRLLHAIIPLLVIILLSACQGGKSTKGYDYSAHRKDNAQRVKETRERNKKSKNLLNHKGKSVKKPKPEYP